MEPASELLARPLPPLRFAGGTLYPSVSSERLHESFMHQWTTFEQEIQSALDSLDLNHTVSHTDSADGEFYLVGNEIGLTGRFVNNPCDPVAKILSRASIPSVAFGDIQALLAASSIILGRGLGVTSRNDSKTTVMAVGELKTFWTLPLERLPVVNHLARVELEPYLGQLVAQMRKFQVRYAFLSTYKATVFVKRADNFSFLISRPIGEQDTNLSVRQCFAAFCILAEQDSHYAEDPEFNPHRLSHPQGVQVSLHQSGLRDFVTSSAPTNVTTEAIMIGENGGAFATLNAIRKISRLDPPGKALFEVDLQGVHYIVKCWGPNLDEPSATECAVYERMLGAQPGGYDVFAKPILWGDIICSSLFPAGRALVLSKKDGRRLAEIWNDLNNQEQNHVREQCWKAIRILRSLSIRVMDVGKHNILYSRETGAVTLLDFETAVECPASELVPLEVEMNVIFGEQIMREPMIGG